MTSIPNYLEDSNVEYRVILCKYNEIALKSLPYQDKILNILLESIKLIIIRENLSLQSALLLSGRLLFFFPSHQINQAIHVFRHIIGLQSISPAISTTRKYEKLQKSLLQYLSQIIHTDESFTLHFKSIIDYPINASDFKQEIYTKFYNNINTKKHDISQIEKKMKEIHIEIREKGTYIYHLNIPTAWGGFPIESKNSLLCPWSGDFREAVAAQLLLRRGSIITPIIFQTNLAPLSPNGNLSYQIIPLLESTSDLYISELLLKSLGFFAKFYSASLPFLIVNITPLLDTLQSEKLENNEYKVYLYYGILKILEKLINLSKIQAKWKFSDRNLHYSGFISPLTIKNTSKVTMGQNFDSLQLLPLTGLKIDDVKMLYRQIQNPDIFFSFNQFVSQKEDDYIGENISPYIDQPEIYTFLENFDEFKISSFVNHDNLLNFYKQGKINKILDSIIENISSYSITGKILS